MFAYNLCKVQPSNQLLKKQAVCVYYKLEIKVIRNYTKKKRDIMNFNKSISFIFFIFVLLHINSSSASNLNPLKRDVIESTNYNKSLLDKIGEPVHEFITRKAREQFWARCQKEMSQSSMCSLAQVHPKTINDSLIRGVWWNDDPEQDLYKARQLRWFTHMTDAKQRAKSSKYNIGYKYYLVYRSHYGDMQFLHSMASKEGETADTTKNNMFKWLEFVYNISIGNITRNQKFSEVDLKISKEYFPNKQDWEIDWELQPRYRLKNEKLDFKLHALGSFLHIIQDSYSAAHTSRNYKKTNTCPKGTLESFNSYTYQDSSEHKKADTMDAFNSVDFNDSGPIETSAEIMWLVSENADWRDKVIPYLEKNVFCLSDKDHKSTHGGWIKT
jgi:hypothetical protein